MATALLVTSLAHSSAHVTRRDVVSSALAATTAWPTERATAALTEASLDLKLSSTGLKWAELRAGSGIAPASGQRVTIDYMMTRRAGSKIYSTIDSKQPFSWTLGDGSVIEGLELALLGSGDLPPMLMGGARRVVLPQALAYGRDRGFFSGGAPTEIRNLQPVPPDFWWEVRRMNRHQRPRP